MKHTWSLLFSGFLVCCLIACSGRDGWRLEGKTSFPQFSRVLLLDKDGGLLDSVEICNGTFHLELPGEVEQPCPVQVRLLNVDNTDDLLNVPVMVENGMVHLSVGEYIHIGGTLLNDAIQEFLNGLQDCRDKCLKQTYMGEEEITRIFSGFYLQQIAIHRHDALGTYIFRNYGIHLNKEDNLKAKELLNIK